MSAGAAAARDPAMLAHRYDPVRDAVHFLLVPRALHGDVTFITDDCLPKGLEPQIVVRRDAVAAGASPAPIHFIFHSAFCCSTLLARAYDRPGAAVAATAALFGLPTGGGLVDEIVAGPAFTLHSKHGAAFAVPDRDVETRDAARVHGGEIGKVAIWAEAVAAAMHVAIDPPGALLPPGRA